MALDRRTYIIIIVMLIIFLPIVIYVFWDNFSPILSSLKTLFTSADLYQSAGTGVPIKILNGVK